MILIGCSHGTDSRSGRAVIRALLTEVGAARPDLDVAEAFVDVQQPRVGHVVESLSPRQNAVVVPLLLSAGYHVNVDIAAAVAGGQAAAAAALGPDDRLTTLLAQRLREAGVRAGDRVVLAAAGSSDPRATADVERVAADLRQRHEGPVTVGYGSIATPSVAEAVATARDGLPHDARVVVASYLLAPGFFYDRIRAAGADIVTAPLAPHPLLTEIVLDRYRAVAQALPDGSDAGVAAAAGDERDERREDSHDLGGHAEDLWCAVGDLLDAK